MRGGSSVLIVRDVYGGGRVARIIYMKGGGGGGWRECWCLVRSAFASVGTEE